jgi:hypothetical protein
MRLSHHRLISATLSACAAISVAFLAASAAWGHGMQISQNNYPLPPTALMVSSMQPVLDTALNPPGQSLPPAPTGQPYATQGPSNLFTDEFGSTPMVGNGGATYYETYEGFVELDGVSTTYNFSTGMVASSTTSGTWGIQSATFHILSPLYYADGNAIAAAAASAGTYIEFSVNPAEYDADPSAFPSAPLSDGGPDIEISGSTSVVAGFPVSGSDFHELLKDIYIAPGSTQTYGEYGYAYDVTFTLQQNLPFLPDYGDTVTLTTPPMVNVFALTDPDLPGGDYGDDAPYTQQDVATMQIYDAAMASAQAVPEPSTFVLGGIGFVAFALLAWRRRFVAQALPTGGPN